MDVPRFAEEIARLGAFRYADALGVHPYSRKQPDQSGSSLLELPKLHTRLSRVAGRPVDLWVTEYGFPNATVPNGYGPPADEREQALRLQKAFALVVWLKRLTWYGLRDDCGSGRHADCRFGLVREDFSPKLGWYGFLQVLAGNLPLLDSRVSVHRRWKLVRRRGRRRRSHTLYGGLETPGTEPARGRVVIRLARRYKGHTHRRRFRVSVSGGRYRLKIGRLRPGRWRFRAVFKGDSRYAASRSGRLSLRVRR